MATKKPTIQGIASALSNEVRAAGYASTADKLEIQNAIHSHRVPETGSHTVLSDDEVIAQAESVLDFPEEIKVVQAIEYGTWVAVEDIFLGAALAYAIGHPVPVSNVEKHRYDELGAVRRVVDRSVKQETPAKEVTV